jgi:two-component system, cell cycle sensor histidine kinase and response regulator CckA
MAFLILRHPVRPRSMFYGVIGSLLALGGVMILGRGIWSLYEPQFHIFLDSPVQLIFFVSVVAIQLGETLAFMMLNTERVESELVEAEGELSKTVDGLQKVLAEQKRVEESLRESEEKYRNLFNNAEVGMFRTRLDGSEVLDINDKALQIFSRTREEVQGNPAVIHWVDPSEREEMIRRLSTDGRVADFECKMLNKQGEVRICMTSLRLYQEQGILEGSAIDITERKRAEENLRDSEARLWDLYDNAPNAYFSVGTDGLIRKCNKGAEELLGYPREMLEGKRVLDLYMDGPEGKEKAAKVFQKFISGGQVTSAELQMQKSDGSPVWISLSVNALRDVDGKVVESRSAVVDITKRKRAEEALRASEEKYRAVFDNAGIGIDLLDRDGRILQVNQSLLDMLGYSEEELHQLTFLDITHPEEREISKRNLEALMTGEIESYRLEKRYLRKDRSILWADLTTSAIRGPNGEHSGTVAVISDVTDRKKARQEREQLGNQLAQAQKMEAIGTLTGGIAHDFNNLLTIILGYSEMLLLDRDEKDPAYDDLQKIMQSARNGAEMVQRLLVFSRRAETNPVPLDLNRQVRNTEPLLSHTLPKMIRIEMRLDDDLGLVRADPAQMDQIVMNLAINAKEAMPDGGILTLETTNVTLKSEFCARHPGVAPGDYVLLSISDTGQGMGKEIQDRMFDPFFTVKGWDSRKGTGLGLPVVLGIVQHHGGCIECLSEVGKGTTFNIYLPKFTAEPLSDQADSRDVSALGTETILLVDDEDLVRELGERILTKSGYRVLMARNGREALDIYKQHQPDIALVILDLIMPEMSGKECLRELVKIDPQVRVIVSSGHSDSEDPHEVPHEFVRASVKKPYLMRQLLETVRSALDA